MQEIQTMVEQTTRQPPLQEEANNGPQVKAMRSEENNVVTPLHDQETVNQIDPTSMITTERENVRPNCNARTSTISKALFNDSRGNGAPTKFISTQQLISCAKTRASKKRQLQDIQAGQ